MIQPLGENFYKLKYARERISSLFNTEFGSLSNGILVLSRPYLVVGNFSFKCCAIINHAELWKKKLFFKIIEVCLGEDLFTIQYTIKFSIEWHIGYPLEILVVENFSLKPCTVVNYDDLWKTNLFFKII